MACLWPRSCVVDWKSVSSLAQVKELFKTSPRTCEYYYVFADGEDRSAVGVAATPEKIEFIDPANRILDWERAFQMLWC